MTEAIKVLPVQRALQGRGTYSQAESICTRTESCSWQPERQTRRLCLRIKWQYKTNCMQTSSSPVSPNPLLTASYPHYSLLIASFAHCSLLVTHSFFYAISRIIAAKITTI